MRVLIELAEPGVRMLKAGWREIRGNTPDATGQHWSVRLYFDEPIGDGQMFGEARFTSPEAERQLPDTFEIRAGIVLLARCTPGHGHD